jgi:uncharacterized protein (DUF2342 family)
MLRLFVLALLLLNGIYFTWSQGLLRPYGFAPEQQGEPQRVTQQIKPEGLKLLSKQEVGRVEAQVLADLAPKECLQAGPLDDAQVAALRRQLEASLPAGSWQVQTVQIPQRWIVYMGKYPNEDAMVKKRAELTGLKLQLEPLQNPTLEIGLSLGGYLTQAEATAALALLNQRGIRTARVVQELAGGNASLLKLPGVTEALKSRLVDLKPALGALTFKPCG